MAENNESKAAEFFALRSKLEDLNSQVEKMEQQKKQLTEEVDFIKFTKDLKNSMKGLKDGMCSDCVKESKQSREQLLNMEQDTRYAMYLTIGGLIMNFVIIAILILK